MPLLVDRFRWYVAHWALTLSETGSMEDVEAGKAALPEVIADLTSCVDVYLKKETPPGEVKQKL